MPDRLVAFPTETVYGLGANALDPVAVARIFEAKGAAEHESGDRARQQHEMVGVVASAWPDESSDTGRSILAGTADTGASQAAGSSRHGHCRTEHGGGAHAGASGGAGADRGGAGSGRCAECKPLYPVVAHDGGTCAAEPGRSGGLRP